MNTSSTPSAPAPYPGIDEVAKTSGLPVPWEHLGALSFFEGFEAGELKQIAAHTKLSYFAPGEAILEQGDLANRFYILLSGRAAVEYQSRHERIRVEELGAGDAIGFSWLFSPDKLHFTARAVEPVAVVFFYGTLLREDCEIDPRLGYHLLQRASQLMLRRLENVIALLARLARPADGPEAPR